MSFKFLQISDLHFDTPLLMGDSALLRYQEEQRRAFSAAVDLAIDKKVNAFIICGDLYYEDNLSFETAELLSRSFRTLYRKGIRVVYAHGAIDPSPLPSQLKSPGLIEFYKKEIVTSEVSLAVGLESVSIVGIGYSDDLLPVTERITPKDDTQPMIGVVYVNPSEYPNPVLEGIYQHLKRTQFNYWALGGRHGFGTARGYQNMTYSGSPTGASYRESPSGAALVSLDDVQNIHVERVPLSPITWHNINVKDLESAEDLTQLQELLSHTVASSVRDVQSAFVCLSLSGQTKLYDQLDTETLRDLSEKLTSQSGAAVTVVSDHLYPAVDVASFRREKTPLAETLKLIARLEMDEATMKKAIEYALSTEGFYTMEEGKAAYHKDVQALINGLDKYVGHAMLKETES